MSFFFTCIAFAQEVKFNRISNKEGLSQSTVNCILQDRYGFMWFGTQEGLNCYNGYEFKVFINNPSDETSLSDNYINAVLEDRHGQLWIGTNGGGVNRYDRNSNKFLRLVNSETDNHSLSDNRVKAIVEAPDGNVWIGTEHGLNIGDNDHNSFRRIFAAEHPDSLQNDAISTLFIAKNKTIWLGTTGGGIFSYDDNKKIFKQHKPNRFIKPVRFESTLNQIRCIEEDKEGNLWIGTEGGLLKYLPARQRTDSSIWRAGNQWELFTSGNSLLAPTIINNKILSVKQLKNGKIWFGTFGGGINVLDNESKRFDYLKAVEDEQNSLSDDYIRVIYEDRAGSVWVGTNNSGLNVYHPSATKFRHFRKREGEGNTMAGNMVFALLADRDGLLWIGTASGLRAFDKNTDNFLKFDTLASAAQDNAVLSLMEDREGLLWVGTYGGGISSFGKKTGEIKFFRPGRPGERKNTVSGGTVTCLAQDRDGLIWAGTYGDGLNSFDKRSGKFENYMNNGLVPAKNIYCIYQDKKGILWIGTENYGLFSYNKQNRTAKNFLSAKNQTSTGGKNNGNNSIGSNTVNAIYEDTFGNLWLGTANGLDRFNIHDRSFLHYSVIDGLAGNYIYGILGDEAGNIWMSTNHGISKLMFIDRIKNSIAFKNFDTDDGLQHNEFNQGAYFKSADGEMFFGGINGFNAFFPGTIRDNLDAPQVCLTSFKKFGKEFNADSNLTDKKSIELTYRDKFFSFEFVALNFIFPEHNRYSYKLEGFDIDWTPPSPRRYAGYTNIPGGDYVFHVRGSNNDGVWNETGAAIAIHITPPFWETEWFYSLCIVSGLIFIYGFTKIRTLRIEGEKKILETKVTERTYELAEKNRDILSSIEYAERIQNALLPSEKIIMAFLPETFIYYRPRDIVSGDFYWMAPLNPPTSLRPKLREGEEGGIFDTAESTENAVDSGIKSPLSPSRSALAKQGGGDFPPEADPHQAEGGLLFAAADCTGHGVPGAFMSMIGHNLLNHIIIKNRILDPGSILNSLNREVQSALKQSRESDTQDGMDIAICRIEPAFSTEGAKPGVIAGVYFAGANNPLYIVRGNNYPLAEFRGSDSNPDDVPVLHISDGENFPIGGAQFLKERIFRTHHFNMYRGDTIYMFTDGFADQFGGPDGKKYMTKRFRKFITGMNHLTMAEQKLKIAEEFDGWKGTANQVDDVLVIGIRF